MLSDPVGETEKLAVRLPRSLADLARALTTLPSVRVYDDNSDLERPFRLFAEYRDSCSVRGGEDVPAWFRAVVGPG